MDGVFASTCLVGEMLVYSLTLWNLAESTFLVSSSLPITRLFVSERVPTSRLHLIGWAFPLSGSSRFSS
jgi:hypothetical protein